MVVRHWGDLVNLLSNSPQRTVEGKVRYLLTSGFAVQVITGVVRNHRDIDVVLFESKDIYRVGGADYVYPESYWGDMYFSQYYLEQTAFEGNIDILGKRYSLLTVHPAIILIQKLADYFGHSPRPKDLADARALIVYLAEHKEQIKVWSEVMGLAIAALPPSERDKTKTRLATEIYAFRQEYPQQLDLQAI